MARARKDVKVLSAWIDKTKKTIQCKGVVSGIDIEFSAFKVGALDAEGKVPCENMESLELKLAEIKQKITKNAS